MPGLADLASSLRDIKFGKDTPGGGNSGEPYVVMPIGSRWSPSNFDDGYGSDGIIATTTRTVADIDRITSFFVKSVKGPLFLAKQVGLQLSNVQLEHREDRPTNAPTTGQGFFNNVTNFISNTANKVENNIGTTRIYNPLGTNTLAQVAVEGFGQHVPRHGLLPVMNDSDKYESVVKDNNQNGSNRLVHLAHTFEDASNNHLPIAEYSGGPQSKFGIGTTTIRRASNVNTLNSIDSTATQKITLLRGFTPIPLRTIASISSGVGKIDPSTTSHPTVVSPTATDNEFDFSKEDFRILKNRIRTAGQTELPQSDYPNLNMEKRVGVPRARTSHEYTPDYTIPVPGAADKINAISLFYNDLPFDAIDVNGNPIDQVNNKDLIKFRIKALDNDNPKFGVYMIFRAFINSAPRRFNAKWEPYSYVGRGENFYLYNGFTDQLSLSFTICAFSRMEMKPIYQKLNYLISTLAPDYKNNKMRGNLIELTVGDWLRYQPGIITSLHLDIPEEANWEIALGDPLNDPNQRDIEMHELPMLLKCNLNFIPIYNFLPHKSAEAPFISLNDEYKREPRMWIEGTDSKLNSQFSKMPQ